MPSVSQPSQCCSKCGDEIVTQVPGPAGATGAAGTNGTDGVNAYTTTTLSFITPTIGFNVTVEVVDSSWMAVGQVLYLKDPNSAAASFFRISAINSATSIDIFDPGFTGDAIAGTTFGVGTFVVVGGLQGPSASGTIPINQGGTGQVTALAAFNALSVTTTKGDLIVDNGATSPVASDVRLALGASKRVLTCDPAQPTGLRYGSVDLSGSLTSIIGAAPIANGGTGQITQTAAFDALSPLTTAGDIIYRNGTNNVRLPIGTAGQILTVNGGGTAIQWSSAITSSVIQMLSTSTASYSSVVGVIPFDNTVPQIGEGTLLLTLNFTPLSATSRVVIEGVVNVAAFGGGVVPTIALFNGAANALSAAFQATSQALPVVVQYEYVPGSTAAIVFTLRVGVQSGAADVNGYSGAAILGGSQRSWLRAVEYS